MATRKKKEKLGAFQPSGDVSRIIPCQGGWAYISDHNGRNHHLKIEEEEFIRVARETDEALNGKIKRELEALGWTQVLEAM